MAVPDLRQPSRGLAFRLRPEDRLGHLVELGQRYVARSRPPASAHRRRNFEPGCSMSSSARAALAVLCVPPESEMAQRVAERGSVLLKNAGRQLPLAKTLKSIAVIGSHADVAVLSGAGSAQVDLPDSNAVRPRSPAGGPARLRRHVRRRAGVASFVAAQSNPDEGAGRQASIPRGTISRLRRRWPRPRRWRSSS